MTVITYKMCRMVYYVCNFHIILLLILFRKGYSVPEDYCLHPLNRSDCNMTPTPVFSYYKPGSRCEIEFWRGCPTFNKFPNEAICSHYCIGKLFRYRTDENTVLADIHLEFPKNPCNGVLNTTQCSQQETKVFTFSNNSCVEATWRGCETENKFDDEQTCKQTCVKDDLQNWQQQLNLLLPADIKEIDKIIDDVIKEEITTEAETTSHKEYTTEVTSTESTTEATTKPVKASTETTTIEVPATTTELPTTTSEEPTTTETTTSSTTTEPTTTTTSKTTTIEPPGDADEVITT